MKFVLFYHSLLSDWNHGNAHFLRGVASELVSRGHQVDVYEPEGSWSYLNLRQEHGEEPLREFAQIYPSLRAHRYGKLELEEVLLDADCVMVHEWNPPELVQKIGEHRKRNPRYRLLFHDTHHRAVTAPREIARYDLRHFDGVLAFGAVLTNIYRSQQWAERVWTWHEAADTRVFKPLPWTGEKGDLVWIGNWGDDERTEELYEYLIRPIQALRLKAQVYGVRYPEQAREMLDTAGAKYRGWTPNFKVPHLFSRHHVTVHVPRRPYVKALPGIPTIRPFEALACGIPLVSAPWNDAENLFTPGKDYLVARSGEEMSEHLTMLLHDEKARREIADHGLATIRARHTCVHRVNELLGVVAALSA